MNLFLIERTGLGDLMKGPHAPKGGDVVTCFRDAQDPDGLFMQQMNAAGIDVFWAEDLLTDEDCRDIDAFNDRVAENWYIHNGEDISSDGLISIGHLFTYQLFTNIHFNLVVKFGSICRILFDRYSGVETLFTDIRNAQSPLFAIQLNLDAFPRRSLLGDLSKQMKVQLNDLPASNPLKSLHSDLWGPKWGGIVRSFIGGFRLRFLLPRLRQRFGLAKTSQHRIYFFLSSGLALLANNLGKGEAAKIFGDRPNVENVTPYRHDHLFALPGRKLISAAWNLWRYVNSYEGKQTLSELAAFRGVNYGPIIQRQLKRYLLKDLIPNLVTSAQAQKLMKKINPDLVIMNGAGSPYIRTVYDLAKRERPEVIFMDHGLCLTPTTAYSGRNYPHVHYVAHGQDHASLYGRTLPEGQKPKTTILTTPMLHQMAPIKGKRRQPPQKHVLILNYAPQATQSVARTRYCDRYYLDIFEVASRLLDNGFTFSYRGHQGDNPRYILDLIESKGLQGKVSIDRSPLFADALMQCDAVLCNVGTCFYQTLYAGWPTIFYQPGFNPDHYVGLPAAVDIEQRPIAKSPEELERLLIDAMLPDSGTSKFPERFTSEYAPRFLGDDHDIAIDVLSDFLDQSLSSQQRV